MADTFFFLNGETADRKSTKLQVGLVDTGTTIGGQPVYALRVDGGTSFPMLAPDGTAGAPSYSFINEPDTGMFLSAANRVGMTSGGVHILDIYDNDTNTVLSQQNNFALKLEGNVNNYLLLNGLSSSTWVASGGDSSITLSSAAMALVSTTFGALGVTPAAQQTGGAATAGAVYTATEQEMIQKAYNALRTFGFLS